MKTSDTAIPLCRLRELSDPGSRGFRLEIEGHKLEMFVVRSGGEVFGYLNHCPHTGAPLEWMPHRFLDVTESLIQCAMHGALFDIEHGRCLRGPCAGQSLLPVEVKVRRGAVLLNDPTTASKAWRNRQ